MVTNIGLLTFHIAHNYGAFLQTYALCNTLKRKENCAVSIINYCPAYLVNPYKPYRIPQYDHNQSFLKNIVRIIGGSVFQGYNIFARLKRDKYFKTAQSTYLPLTIEEYLTYDDLKHANLDLDICIAGSDMIWSTRIAEGKLDPVYFLGWLPQRVKKCSYGACIGTERVPDVDIDVFKKEIANFDMISMRESASIPFVKECTDKEITCVLDPTLLLTKDDWLAFSKEPSSHPNAYLLVFCIYGNISLINKAKEIAKSLKLEIVYIGLKSKHLKYLMRHVYVPLEEFIWYFAHASFVITDSFHGTVFSVNFEKPFYSIADERQNKRHIDHLSRLGLLGRLYNYPEDLTEISAVIDYTHVNEKLTNLRRESLNYIDLVCSRMN